MEFTSNGKKVKVQRIVDAQQAKAIRVFFDNGIIVFLKGEQYKPILKFTEESFKKAVQAELKKKP